LGYQNRNVRTARRETAAMGGRVGVDRHRRSGTSFLPAATTHREVARSAAHGGRRRPTPRFSIAVMDVAREKLGSMAKYKIQVIPKAKLCEALKASDYTCDVLLDETQANQLGRFLSVNAYTSGTLERSGGAITATVRVRDIGSSGPGPRCSRCRSATPGTAASVGRGDRASVSTTSSRAAEAGARTAEDQRKKSQFCEGARRRPQRAGHRAEPPGGADLHRHRVRGAAHAAGQPAGGVISGAHQRRLPQRDRVGEHRPHLSAEGRHAQGDRRPDPRAFGRAAQHTAAPRHRGAAPAAEAVRASEGAPSTTGSPRTRTSSGLIDSRQRNLHRGRAVALRPGRFSCSRSRTDSSKAKDSTFLKARARLPRRQGRGHPGAPLLSAAPPSRIFPGPPRSGRRLGRPYDLKGQKDSSVWAYKQSLKIDPSDVKGSLLVARGIVEGATYDTAQANKLKSDTAALHAVPQRGSPTASTARRRISPPPRLTSPDSSDRLSASVVHADRGIEAGAGGCVRSRPTRGSTSCCRWSRRAPRRDTVGPRQQIPAAGELLVRGGRRVASLSGPYSAMVKSKSCTEAKGDQRSSRPDEGGPLVVRRPAVHPPTANQMLQKRRENSKR